MEHIGKVLAQVKKDTHSQMNYENPGNDEPVSSEDVVWEKLKRFGISSLEHTFENFKVRAETQEAMETLKAVSAGGSSLQFVLLNGITGCGKTHLIEATIIEWAKRGLRTRYYTFSDIARDLKRALREHAGKYEVLFNSYSNVQRLIVDDIGMGTTESRFEISDLEDIIDLRYRKRYYPDLNLVTIIATNKDLRELSERVISRFYDPEFGKVLNLGDKDYRRRFVK